MRAWACLAGVAVLWAGAASAQTSDPVVDALDRYFREPSAPETFRALSGQGDPGIAPEYGYEAHYYTPRSEDADLLAQLIPGQDPAFVDEGACRLDYALVTLKARIARLRRDHLYVRRWIETQRAVFTACRDDKASAPALPPPLALTDPDLARLQADDRAYQQASLLFYSGQRKAALAAFQAIARSGSTHRLVGRYMVAALHAGTPSQLYGEPEPMVPVAAALREAQGILDDPAAKPIHPLAQQLLGWVGSTVADAPTRKAQVLATLAALEQPAAALAADPIARRRYALARADIERLHQWREPPDWWLSAAPPPEFTASRAMMEAASTDPLASWSLVPASYLQGHAWALFDRGGWARGWRPLFEYAEAHAGPDGAAFAWARLAHVLAVEPSPNGWETVQAEIAGARAGDPRQTAALALDFYHQVRLSLSAYGSSEEAFDPALAAMAGFPFKAAGTWLASRHDGLQYLMTDGRMGEARRWRDALFAGDTPKPRYDEVALLQILAEDEAHFAAALSADAPEAALPLQNELSIAAMTSLARRAETPPVERARFARIAWGRTYALGRTVPADLNRLFRTLNPTMTADWTSNPGKAVKPDDRRALLDVLRSPAVNILIVDVDRDREPSGPDDESPGLRKLDLYNHDDDNWWCRLKVGHHRRRHEAMIRDGFVGDADLDLAGGEAALELMSRLGPALANSWAIRHRDQAELDALAAIDCAPKALTDRTLEWVAHPSLFRTREGQAEALALAVRATRYGCYSDGPLGRWSRSAFTQLHTRFPDTDWAKRTKYWFDCPLGGKDCTAVTDP